MSQVVGLEADAKKQKHKITTELHKAMQKAELFRGTAEVFEPAVEGVELFPPKKVKVRLSAEEALGEMAEHWIEWWDWTATKDIGNASEGARANVVIDEEVFLEKVPVPLLLFLKDQFENVRKAIEVIPTLDEVEDWVWDVALGFYRTADPVRTRKTRNVKKPIVLYDATKEHPAQTQIIDDVEVMGYWVGTKFSGALSATRKKELLRRVAKVLEALKIAKEEANNHRTQTQNIGEKLFSFVLNQAEAS
jgi:hypothetical protein